jgi:hypothetical protein
MPYIFINPVTQNMYDKSILENFLLQNGFEQVYCQEDWISAVKNEYKNTVVLAGKKTVIDMRCQRAVYSVRGGHKNEEVYFPEIEPILIHCARELSGRYAEKDRLVITSPCRSLADYGNSLGIKNTEFVSWNDFAVRYGCTLKKVHLEKSPIPPGFFNDTEKEVLSLTGEQKIRESFEKKEFKAYSLVELLFCSGGCNNGDGVV